MTPTPSSSLHNVLKSQNPAALALLLAELADADDSLTPDWQLLAIYRRKERARRPAKAPTAAT